MLGHYGTVIRVHSAIVKIDAHIVTQPLGGDRLQLTIFIQFDRPDMYDAAVEGHAVTGLHVTTHTTEAFRISIYVVKRRRIDA